MSIPFIYCSSLTGGAAGALDAVSIDDIVHNEMAFVGTSSSAYIYKFDYASDDAENYPNVIRPDDATSVGRWKLQNLGVSGGSGYSYALFCHKEAAGVDGGAITASVWTSRPYNSEIVNEISDASLSSNSIILPPGVYDFKIIDVGYKTGKTKIKLLNETTGIDIQVGVSAKVGTTVAKNRALIMLGRFTLTEKSSISTKVMSNKSQVNGLGNAVNIDGMDEIYGVFEIWRVGVS